MRRYPYNGYGQVDFDAQAGLDIAIELATVGETAASVTTLLKMAGVSAKAPVYGWIVAGVLAGIAGVMAFVGAAKRKDMKVDMVAPLAEQYGFPQAIVFPQFVIDALQPNREAWRALQARELEKDIAAGKGDEWINRGKLQFLGIVEVYDLAMKRSAAGLPMLAPSEADVKAVKQAVRDQRSSTKMTKKTTKLVVFGGATLIFVMLAYVILDD